MRAVTRLWEPWIAWAYGASFDRRTEEHVPEVGLEIIRSSFVVDDLIKLISVLQGIQPEDFTDLRSRSKLPFLCAGCRETTSQK
jgi:hypothetical protein